MGPTNLQVRPASTLQGRGTSVWPPHGFDTVPRTDGSTLPSPKHCDKCGKREQTEDWCPKACTCSTAAQQGAVCCSDGSLCAWLVAVRPPLRQTRKIERKKDYTLGRCKPGRVLSPHGHPCVKPVCISSAHQREPCLDCRQLYVELSHHTRWLVAACTGRGTPPSTDSSKHTGFS